MSCGTCCCEVPWSTFSTCSEAGTLKTCPTRSSGIATFVAAITLLGRAGPTSFGLGPSLRESFFPLSEFQ